MQPAMRRGEDVGMARRHPALRAFAPMAGVRIAQGPVEGAGIAVHREVEGIEREWGVAHDGTG